MSSSRRKLLSAILFLELWSYGVMEFRDPSTSALVTAREEERLLLDQIGIKYQEYLDQIN